MYIPIEKGDQDNSSPAKKPRAFFHTDTNEGRDHVCMLPHNEFFIAVMHVMVMYMYYRHGRGSNGHNWR